MTEDNSERRDVTPAEALKLYNSIIRHEKAAAEHREQAWRKYIELGRWILERRKRASAQADGTTRGSIYAAALQKLLGKFQPTYKQLSDHGTLTYLMYCVDNFEAVNAFRNEMPEEDRPSHPQRVWEAYQLGSAPPMEFSGDEESADEDDPEADEREAEGKRRQPKSKAKSDRRKLIAEIEVLKEKLEEWDMTTDPQINAERIWRRLVSILGDRHAPQAARLTADELGALAERMSAREWEDAGS